MVCKVYPPQEKHNTCRASQIRLFSVAWFTLWRSDLSVKCNTKIKPSKTSPIRSIF